MSTDRFGANEAHKSHFKEEAEKKTIIMGSTVQSTLNEDSFKSTDGIRKFFII